MSGAEAFPDVFAWLLGGVRLAALFTTAPVFGHTSVPLRLRAGLGALMAWSLAPRGAPPVAEELLGAAGLVLGELLLGLALGFAIRLVFAAFDLLGEFVSIQGGLGAASVVDPNSRSSSLALASAFQSFVLMIFLAIDGHHEIVRAAALCFERVPLGAPPLETAGLLGVVRSAAAVFEVAVRIAAPITVAMLLSNVGMGILGRTIPQLNLMLLQLPAHIALTLALLMLGAGAWVRATGDVLADWVPSSMTALLGAG